ncbi:copper ion binding protein [Maribellus sp. YY47]|uniref:heavy-metal-associated domain-containing protein n=1 Tax=Maribellus sp. YY47 TaxID=2929486 RepID=UPI00200165D6|nr:copper ion binding protein [Maribellus sp. YY47]MCK3682666.1 copper ion binding protein [Maribellus sp. YY47]
MKKVLFLLLTVGLFACGSAEKKTETKATAQAEITEVSLSIGGMTCEHCVMSVEKGINSLEGIEAVKVTLADSTAVVKYNASVLQLDDIKEAVKKRGYEVKSAE